MTSKKMKAITNFLRLFERGILVILHIFLQFVELQGQLLKIVLYQ